MTFPPYAASAKWYAQWLKSLAEGNSDSAAIVKANVALEVAGKGMARCLVGTHTGEPLMLSVAVEGGARRLRDNSNLSRIKLSDHGDWRRTHMAALSTIYGKWPYFDHIADRLKPVYSDGDIEKLKQFNLEIHKVISSFLIGGIEPTNINKTIKEKKIEKRCLEIANGIQPELSILDALMLHGPETILGISEWGK